MPFKFRCAYVVFRKQVILRCVGAELEHRRILEIWILCHDEKVFLYDFSYFSAVKIGLFLKTTIIFCIFRQRKTKFFLPRGF